MQNRRILFAVLAVVATGGLGCGARDEPTTAADECPNIWFVGDASGAPNVALDENYAYWATVAGKVQRGSLATGDVVDLAELETDYAFVRSVGDFLLVADGPRLLWMSKHDGSYQVLAVNGDKWMLNIIGNAHDAYFREPDIGNVSSAGRLVHWTQAGGFKILRQQAYHGLMALDADSMYFANPWSLDGPANIGAVLQFDRETDAETILAENQIVGPFGIEVRGPRLVVATLEDNLQNHNQLEAWLNIYSNGSWSRMSLEDGTGHFTKYGAASGFALDDENVYITRGLYDGELVKVPLAGGASKVVFQLPDINFGEPVLNDTHIAIPMFRLGYPAKTNVDFANVVVLCK